MTKPVASTAVHLSPSSVRVLDADEEVFLLYTSASSYPPGHAGLGSVDSRHDEIVVSIEIKPRELPEYPAIDRNITSRPHKLPRTSRAAASQHLPHPPESKTFEVSIAQDTTSLRSRKGDTGSVLWRASVELARAMLQDIIFPQDAAKTVFEPEKLRDVHVLELGAGTGLLGILLSPHVAHYTITDLPELLPLISKNLSHNLTSHTFSPQMQTHGSPPRKSHKSPTSPSRKGGSPLYSTPKHAPAALHTSSEPSFIGSNYVVSPLDWVLLASAPPSSAARTRIRKSTLPNEDFPVDLIIAVDTIFNVSLIRPFLAVLDEFAHGPMEEQRNQSEIRIPDIVEGLSPPRQRGTTLVLVVCELRDEDVMQNFLEEWIGTGKWEIWRLMREMNAEHDTVGSGEHNVDDGTAAVDGIGFLDGPFVAWLGYKI